jgi:hypothetical protein
MLCAKTRISSFQGEKMSEHGKREPYLRLSIPLICAVLAGCGGPSGTPEEAVRAWVADGEVAAESKDRRGLVDMISESYADARGNERQDIGNLMRFYFLRQENVAILTKVDNVAMHGDSAAEVSLTVGLAGMNDSLFSLSANAFQFELELEFDGDDWLLIGARWGELGKELR